ncbi:hypothetical protein GW590_19395 [Rahnella sp. SAP-1]|uniref:Lipoprotein n=1 Tax=Rouxiella aceris TaxID=2703884 RepID=A0A848MSS0_9GAMM|nr:hypothetical protein [Rouxiella aceris]NMP29024.1 hypothetical protein [Rouxiella aceris]
MQNILLIFLIFSLSACTLHARFTPESDKLNDATQGVTYYEQINIFGGPVYSFDKNGSPKLVGEITPKDTGLYVQQCNDKMRNNCIQIRGVPTKAGIVKVRVSGGLSGAMLQKSSQFDKTYTIIIKKPEGSS